MDRPAPAVLREYALLADGHRGLVLGPYGDIAWGCFPRWDSDAVFATLLGGEGFYRVCPNDRFVWGGYYEEGSLIWRSRWVTQSTSVECREALAYPGDPQRATILRRVIAADGDVEMEVTLQLRARFGELSPRDVQHASDGSWSARIGDLYVRWSGVTGARYDRRTDTLIARPLVRKGERLDLVLDIAPSPLADPVEPSILWEATEEGWSRAIPSFDGVVAARDVRHSTAVLRGLTGPSGAMVAAATMSLPERAYRDRDYDYRYAWIRDQCFVGQAAALGGIHDLLDDAVRFVGERLLADGPKLRPAYTVDGEPVPQQRQLRLPGYPGSPDVIVGNRAGDQFQLDAFGEALLLFAAAASCDRLDTQGWDAAAAAADAIATRWQDLDAGIWETAPQHYAHSRLICAAGLRRIATVAAPGPMTGRWAALADALLADTAATCVHPSGRWQRAREDDRCDAALLLPQLRGLLPPEDPRSAATRDAVAQHLTRDGYVFRYEVNDRPLGIAEGAFMLCGFWLAMAQLQAGNTVEARSLFERGRAGCGPPGLFTEEYDVVERQLRGNFPQAFVHAGMLEAALWLTNQD